MPNSPRHESARSAIDLMTAWLDTPDGPPDLLIARLRNHIEGHRSGDALSGAITLIMGMIYLCGSLLALREHETGITIRQTLRDLGLEYAQD
jgi:hypothetical protein